jgi:hypothetical protein
MSDDIPLAPFAHEGLYHLHNGVNRVYLEGSWLDGLYCSLEV